MGWPWCPAPLTSVSTLFDTQVVPRRHERACEPPLQGPPPPRPPSRHHRPVESIDRVDAGGESLLDPTHHRCCTHQSGCEGPGIVPYVGCSYAVSFAPSHTWPACVSGTCLACLQAAYLAGPRAASHSLCGASIQPPPACSAACVLSLQQDVSPPARLRATRQPLRDLLPASTSVPQGIHTLSELTTESILHTAQLSTSSSSECIGDPLPASTSVPL